MALANDVFCIFGSTVGLGTHFAFVSAGTSSVVSVIFVFRFAHSFLVSVSVALSCVA